jgi:hypothetical protein
MATLSQPIYRTDVFARQNQRIATTSGSMQPADVFARRERCVAAITSPEQRRFTVALATEGASEPVELTYTTFDRGLPQWAGPVLQSLSRRWGTRPGWDGYRAEPTNPQLVVKLLNILSDLMQQNYLPPQITPLADGGVQAEWHSSGQDFEIVVPADEEPTYYYFNLTSGVEEEADIGLNYAHVQDLIGLLTESNRNA